MIKRNAIEKVDEALARQPAVALIGPRQVGKTTLALNIAASRPSVYIDLELPSDRAKLADPELFLDAHADKLVILDEIHRLPEVFQVLRGIIDKGRRTGKKTGRFLTLGSASIDLLQQSGETLAGRIAYVDMTPLTVAEVGADAINDLWVRGGFPDSFLADDDKMSFALRQDFIRTYLERDIPQFGPRVPSQTLERFWTMLAHTQGSLLNASKLAAGLGVSSPTVGHYIDLLCDLLLVRRLQPLATNTKKRLVKSPKTYIRDSGLLHALLGLNTLDDVLGHPVAGASWEGFVLENIIEALPDATFSFYRTSAGAEVDLVIDQSGNRKRLCVEVKRSLEPTVSKGLHSSIDDLKPDHTFIVYPGKEAYPVAAHITASPLIGILDKLKS